MTRLRVVPPGATRHKIRDIRSAARGRRRREAASRDKVIDLRAYTGRNVICFPHSGGPTSAA
ncbi:MAG: hypothetical protein DIU60_005960 [Actinomycetes bacterium]|jgi:hypothetical protein|nr:MAG: hypothetical protein DIU60_10515 [Actinomycetota bacterium]